jgi:hypothetical protein
MKRSCTSLCLKLKYPHFLDPSVLQPSYIILNPLRSTERIDLYMSSRYFIEERTL